MHTIRNKGIDPNTEDPITDTDFWNQWGSVNPRMALFVKITPKSFWGLDPIGFTSNTRDMTLPGHSGVTFKSAAGITPSVIEQALDNPTNFELKGLYQTGIFEQDDVVKGKWDFAAIEIFSACWDKTYLGELLHFKGNLGSFKDYELFFEAEGRGLIARLSSDASEVTSRYCRVKEFKDSQCGYTGDEVVIDEETYSLEGVIAGLDEGSNRREFYFNSANFISNPSGNPLPPDGFFNNGTITVSDGLNAGVTREILKYEEGGYISVKRAFPYAIDELITVSIKAGCNRTVEDCRKYGNIINFRGEPYVPGIEAMNRVPPPK